MRTNFKLLAAALIVLASACSKNIENNTPLPKLYATMEDVFDVTKTYVSGTEIYWEPGDKISFFGGNTKHDIYTFDGGTSAKTGTFSLTTEGSAGSPISTGYNYAVYPYASTTSIDTDGTISYTFTNTPVYRADSFGEETDVLIAKSANENLTFRHVLGFLKLSVTADEGTAISEIIFSGNNDEKIAGAATINPETLEITWDDAATSVLTMSLAADIALSSTPTEIWIPIPAREYTSGISIHFVDKMGRIFTKSTSNSVTIQRGHIKPMTTFAITFSVPTNELWYISTDGNIVTPHETDGFGSTLLTNTYAHGKGVMTFEGNVLRIGLGAKKRGALRGCNTLKYLYMPNTLSAFSNAAFAGCTYLQTIYLPSNFRQIAMNDNPFRQCTRLKALYVDESNTYFATTADNRYLYTIQDLGSTASYHKANTLVSFAPSGITDVVIPDVATLMTANCFAYASAVNSVTIHDNFTSIPSTAFNYCTGLTTVTIGNGLTSIGINSFNNISTLMTFTCNAVTPPTAGGTFFTLASLSADFKILVPSGSVADYQAADHWNTYAAYIQSQ